MKLDAQIEAVLFWKAEPIAITKLAQLFSVTVTEVEEALVALEAKLSDRGVALMRKDGEVTLRTSPDAGKLIEDLTKEELSRDLGKAGLETLSIVLYQGPISRREIDYIRGVNSNFIVRNLLVRGLIEKIENEKDARAFLYRPTFELLSYMGVAKVEDLPDYAKVRMEIDVFNKTSMDDKAESMKKTVDVESDETMDGPENESTT